MLAGQPPDLGLSRRMTVPAEQPEDWRTWHTAFFQAVPIVPRAAGCLLGPPLGVSLTVYLHMQAPGGSAGWFGHAGLGAETAGSFPALIRPEPVNL